MEPVTAMMCSGSWTRGENVRADLQGEFAGHGTALAPPACPRPGPACTPGWQETFSKRLHLLFLRKSPRNSAMARTGAPSAFSNFSGRAKSIRSRRPATFFRHRLSRITRPPSSRVLWARNCSSRRVSTLRASVPHALEAAGHQVLGRLLVRHREVVVIVGVGAPLLLPAGVEQHEVRGPDHAVLGPQVVGGDDAPGRQVRHVQHHRPAAELGGRAAPPAWSPGAACGRGRPCGCRCGRRWSAGSPGTRSGSGSRWA